MIIYCESYYASLVVNQMVFLEFRVRYRKELVLIISVVRSQIICVIMHTNTLLYHKLKRKQIILLLTDGE